MRRMLVALTGAILLLAQGEALALSMEVLDTSVFVDVYARAETNVRDRPDRTAEVLTLDTAVAVFVREGSSASANSDARSARIPFLARPQRLDTMVDLDVTARTMTSLEAESASSGGGLVRMKVVGQTATDPAAALDFDITLDAIGASGATWSLSYLVFNETLGTQIFAIHASNAGGTVPAAFSVPVGFGDTIRIEWLSELSVLASDGATATGSIHFGSSFGPVVVPEPASALLVLGGFAALVRARRR